MSKVERLNFPIHVNLYSIEVYNSVTFFKNFDPNKTFEKWAVVEADNFVNLPDDLQIVVLPAGLYVIFIHKGPAADGYKTYEFIYKTWLQQSNYFLDNRPHFALMDEKYKNNALDSEEEI